MKKVILALIISLSSSAADSAWNPAHTWVFAVGVLNFDAQGLATWPDEGRVDAVMIEALKKRGVPDGRIVFLKNKEATKSNIQAQFKALLEKSKEGDTLIFYYAGHGGRNYNDAKRPVSLVTYDTKATWLVSDVLKNVDTQFKGNQAMLCADCCHSGGLAAEAAQHKGRVAYAALNSAHVNSRSTGNWTFTQCLADLFSGNAMLDLNSDGKITFAEAAKYCEEEMAFFEGQMAASYLSSELQGEFVLAQTNSTKHARAGEHCEGEEKGKWWKTKVLDSKDGKFYVTWPGWEKKYDCWVGPERLRAYNQPAAIPHGTAVDVEWNKAWYPAKVNGAKYGLHLVHYDGYPESDDEWIPASRLKIRK